MAEVITPKRQAVVDRLRRRIENYRKHQTDCIPRFNQAFTGIVEQNVQDTLALKQRYLENKSKRAAKKTEKKIPDNPLQGLHTVTQFVPKRPAGDDHDGYGHGEGPPPPKQQSKPSPAEPLTKFSVEIVQQLEFTTSAGNNSQISTNVTVKALNTSVKSDLSTTTVSPQPPTPTTVECKREQEDNPEFVDLEQCAAALEKDAAANGGNSFPGFSDLIGDETSDAIITSDAFKDLISEISDFHPAFLKDLDFGGDIKHNVQSGENQTHNHHHHHHHHQQQQQQHVFKTEEDSKSNILGCHQQQRAGMQQQRMYSSGMDFAKAELSPAAQTLKQMAEQHQHKTQLGMNFNPSSKPYSEFQYNNDFIGSPQNNNVNSQQYKPMVSQSPKSNYVSSDNIKQEVFSAQNSPGVYSPGSGKGNQTPTGQPRLSTGFKQQYSPYGSPGAGAHGSPQYTPRAPSQGPPPQAPPPRPPSCPSSTTLQINQAQQLHISQAQGQPIQVSMAQSQNLCTEMKGSTAVSIAAQQGLYMSPISTSSESHGYCSVSQSQSISLTQRHRVGDKMMHPQEKMMHQQEKMMQQQQEKMMQQQQEKMMHQQQEKMMQQQQEKMMQQQQEKMMHQQQEKMMQQQQEKMMQQQQEKMMHPQMIRLPQQQVRPPPPEYKVSQQQLPQLHPSMVQHQSYLPQQRISQQPLPPSGPMMRPGAGGGVGGGGSYMVGGGVPRLQYTRPQRPLGPTLHSGGPEWRHMLQQHQPQRPTFHQGQGVMFSGGEMQMSAAQMQQVSHMSQHQSLAMQHSTPQMSVNLQMQQSMAGARQHHSHPPTSQMSFPTAQTYTPSPATSQYNSPYSSLPLQLPSTNDFNLDFLDHDQDLLSSLESGASFNIHDIL